MQTAIQLAAVLDLLQTGQTVLLPTTEAVADVRRHFDLRQRAAHLGAWEPPRLFSWSQWQASLWDALTLEGLEGRVLLNPLQEESLWAELAPAAGIDGLPASTLRALSRQAAAGLALAAGHLAVGRLASAADSLDTQSFVNWHRAFETHCRTHRLLSRAALTGVLTNHVASGRIDIPSLHLIGFEHLNPSRNELLRAIQMQGSLVHQFALSSSESPHLHASCVIAGDPDTELRWATQFLRQLLKNHADPVFSVALILPDPDKERSLLESLLREFLAPELESITQDLSSTPWHFSSGPALASHLPIVHALQLLRWTLGELSTQEIGDLLLSPYLAHTDPFEARARFESQSLRKSTLLRPEMTLAAFLSFAGRGTQAKSGVSDKRLTLHPWRDLQAAALSKTPRISAACGDWSEHIRTVLKIVGWPGPRKLSPAEFRLTEAWDGALDLLSTLDLLGKRFTLSEVLAELTSEVQRIQIVGAGPEATVQILRLAETEGRLFSAVLVLRATGDLWPPAELAHPLLGWALQRDLGLPGTSASHSQESSLELLRSLGTRCSTLLLATADHDANGPLRLTDLAGELHLSPIPSQSLLASSPVAGPLTPEVFPDPPLPPLPSYRIAGGARVLELQASCGFRAFANLRLSAAIPENRTLGGDARESGQDLHKALEVFWHAITSQSALRALTAAERHAAVSAAVATALEYRRRAQPIGDRWTDAYLNVAQCRLTHLMLHWLETELQRANFAVLQQEEKQLISVGPLELSIRPDRVDEVEGGLVFVDYKTSQSLSVDDWLGDRPLAPQLPLYALLAEPEEVRGVAFGRIRAGKDMGWISLQSEAGLFPRKGSATADDLTEQVALWQAELARLAEEFANGVANVDPKSYPKTCEFCQFRLLCRLDPATFLTTSVTDLNTPDQEQEDQPAR